MFKHLLIATDGSELAQKAVDQGLELAKALGARITAVTVTAPWSTVVAGDMAVGFPVEEYAHAAAVNADIILNKIRNAAASAGVPCEPLHVKDQFPAEGIIEAAKSKGCDLIVLASHGRRGLTKLILGSQAQRVVTLSTIPVLICR